METKSLEGAAAAAGGVQRPRSNSLRTAGKVFTSIIPADADPNSPRESVGSSRTGEWHGSGTLYAAAAAATNKHSDEVIHITNPDEVQYWDQGKGLSEHKGDSWGVSATAGGKGHHADAHHLTVAGVGARRPSVMSGQSERSGAMSKRQAVTIMASVQKEQGIISWPA